MNYKLSVIIPVYNGSRFIQRMVDSVLAQDYSNFEIILVDDGSTDDSLKICKALAETDARIRVVSQTNQGVSKARNMGIRTATGDYVLICDQDDSLAPGMFQKMMGEIANSLEPDIIRCNYCTVSGKNKSESIIDYPYDTALPKNYIEQNVLAYTLYIKNLPNKAVAGHWTFMTKLDLLKKNNIVYDIHSNKMADSRFIIDVLYAAESIVFVKDAFYSWVKRDDSQTHTYSTMFEDIKYFQTYYRVLTCNLNYNFDSQDKIKHDTEMIQDSLELIWIFLRGGVQQQEFKRILSDEYTRSILAKDLTNTKWDWKVICKLVTKENYSSASIILPVYFWKQRIMRHVMRL